MNRINSSLTTRYIHYYFKGFQNIIGELIWKDIEFHKKFSIFSKLLIASVFCLFGLSGCNIFTTTVTETTNTIFGKFTKEREKDGMEMVYVSKGMSQMGNNNGYSDQQPQQDVFLEAFWIDKYEVTNGQYSICVQEGKCTEPVETNSFTREEYYGLEEFDNFPVVHVTWYQASEYCQWVGGGLPTEAQWEKAARGSNGRTYPWGEEKPTCDFVNFEYEDEECVGDTVSVGSYPEGASPYGVMEMSGNVMEWVSDWYSAISYYHMLENNENPTGPDNGELRGIRGGNYAVGEFAVSASFRWRAYPRTAWYDLGFRCVYPVIEE